METLEKLLNNPLVMVPLMGVIAALLDALRDWIKRKWPRGVEAVDRYWDYLRPQVDEMLAEINSGKAPAASAVQRALVAFIDVYRKYERTEPTEAIKAAVKAELEDAAAGGV